MTPQLISEPDLMEWLGCTERWELRDKLAELKIRYHPGMDGRLVTTLGAIDASLLGDKTKHQAVEF